MSFFEGLHADLTEGGGGERRPFLVRLFLALLERFDRLRRRFRGGR
jgi:hypothetical protein